MQKIFENTYLTDATNWVSYTDSNGREFLLRAWQLEVLKLVKKREPIEDFILKLAKAVYGDNKSYFIIDMDNVEQAISGIKKVLRNAGHDIVVSNSDGLIDVDVIVQKVIAPVWDWEDKLMRFIGSKKPIDSFLSEVVKLFFTNNKKRFISISTADPVGSINRVNEKINETGYRLVLTTNNVSGYAKLRAV